ncbi:MAG: D-aminoacyl-tRNA deacylase [Candidatus Caldarchaeum sp.]
MKAVILVSSEDVAAMNVLKVLRELHGFEQGTEASLYVGGGVEARVLDQPALYADQYIGETAADLIVVASRHVSESGRRCLLVHSTGNWRDKAEFGGLPSKLSMTSARAVYTAVHALRSSADELGLRDVVVGLEATHHGPYSEKPLVFVEIGSSPDSWRDQTMAEAAADACLKLCRDKGNLLESCAVGFGGGHYAPNFLMPVFEGRFAVGHIASKHVFPLTEDLVEQAFSKTVEKPRTALVDWDGLKSDHRQALLKTLARMDVEVVRV